MFCKSLHKLSLSVPTNLHFVTFLVVSFFRNVLIMTFPTKMPFQHLHEPFLQLPRWPSQSYHYFYTTTGINSRSSMGPCIYQRWLWRRSENLLKLITSPLMMNKRSMNPTYHWQLGTHFRESWRGLLWTQEVMRSIHCFPESPSLFFTNLKEFELCLMTFPALKCKTSYVNMSLNSNSDCIFKTVPE